MSERKPWEDLSVLQNRTELAWYIDLVRQIRPKKYLEVGTWLGGVLALVATNVNTELVVGIDINESPKDTIEQLNTYGHKATFLHGDSKDPGIISRANTLGPYDLILIDGDHTYTGVKSDWENYGKLAPVIAFHDIYDTTNEGYGTRQLWEEIRQSDQTYELIEFRVPGSSMGYGVVIKYPKEEING